MKSVDKIVKNVEQMRSNAQEQAIFKNLPLAAETFKLIRELDDPEEGPLGKAYACNAMIEQLSEYDTPRFVLRILRQELAWLEESSEKSDWLFPEDVQEDIDRLEAYIDTEALGMEEFCKKYGRHLLFDPVERTKRWEEIYFEVEAECDRRLEAQPRGMGFCFGYWATKHAVLAEYGIDWKSPHIMNPRVMFD
ncbi:MAG: hypothetical protein K6F21_03540 [Bacteroidales bacterium]|nr:hypothetical protein [Bacteroidales bacterium]